MKKSLSHLSLFFSFSLLLACSGENGGSADSGSETGDGDSDASGGTTTTTSSGDGGADSSASSGGSNSASSGGAGGESDATGGASTGGDGPTNDAGKDCDMTQVVSAVSPPICEQDELVEVVDSTYGDCIPVAECACDAPGTGAKCGDGVNYVCQDNYRCGALDD
jgi:hypothetical protein